MSHESLIDRINALEEVYYTCEDRVSRDEVIAIISQHQSAQGEVVERLIAEIDTSLDYFQVEFPKNSERNMQIWADPVSYYCGGISPDDLVQIRNLLADMGAMTSNEVLSREENTHKMCPAHAKYYPSAKEVRAYRAKHNCGLQQAIDNIRADRQECTPTNAMKSSGAGGNSATASPASYSENTIIDTKLSQSDISVIDEPEAVRIMEEANLACLDCKGQPCYWAMFRAFKLHLTTRKPVSSDESKRLKTAIGGLRSIAYGDASTWPKCSSREVAKQALADCGGEKHVD